MRGLSDLKLLLDIVSDAKRLKPLVDELHEKHAKATEAENALNTKHQELKSLEEKIAKSNSELQLQLDSLTEREGKVKAALKEINSRDSDSIYKEKELEKKINEFERKKVEILGELKSKHAQAEQKFAESAAVKEQAQLAKKVYEEKLGKLQNAIGG